MNAYELTLDELTALLTSWGEPAYRAKQVHAGLWSRAATYDEMTDLPASLRSRLAAETPALLEVVTEQVADNGDTIKAALRVGGRHVIETVLMRYPRRVTVCVSSQAGCAMRCGFCATGQMGLEGSLTAGEIASQIIWGRRHTRVSNLVFMGMGEPLANYAATRDAIRLMGLGARHVTVSTVGMVPGIRRLAQDHPQVGLAVSLHAASDELRDELVPVNQRWPLAEVEAAVDEWRRATRRRPSIEWAMIHNVNDSVDQARLLAPVARRLHAHVNLIPLNPTPGWPAQPSSRGRIDRFVETLEHAGVAVTLRDTRGRDIDAACGQLRVSLAAGREPALRDGRQPVPGGVGE